MNNEVSDLLSNEPFDHLALAGEDLGKLSDLVENALALRLVPGGPHGGLGSENKLMSLGGRKYFEVVGPSPSRAEETFLTSWFSGLSRPGLVGFGVETTDAEALHEALVCAGIKATEIDYETRLLPDGECLRYRTFAPLPPDGLQLLTPFFIDWLDSPHPGLSTTVSCELAYLVAIHPDAAAVSAWYERLGIRVPVAAGLSCNLIAELRSAKRRVVLQSASDSLIALIEEFHSNREDR